MEMKLGYETEVGVILKEWEVCSLGDVVTKVGSGITPTGGEKVYKIEGRPFLRSQNVGWGHLLLDDIAFIDEETHSSFLATEIKLDDVLLNITGASIGRSAVADERLLGGNVNQHVCIIRTDASQLNPYYLNFFLLSENGQKQIDSFQAGGNRQGLNFGQIKSFQISLPPLSEQKAIATALSDVDAWITSLDRLIAKKRDIKQATMEQLLTGKTRLPGFSGEWEVQILGEIAEIIDPHPSHRAPPENDNGIPFVGIGDISTDGKINFQTSRIVSEKIFEQHSKRYSLDNGLIGIGRVASIGKVVRLLSNVGKFVVSPTIAVIKPQKVEIDLLFYCLSSKEVKGQFDRISNGSTRQSVGMNVLRNIQLLLPKSLVEQRAIANILIDMDAEISTLEQKRDKIHALKQGLMQELLTGKTRLI